MAASTCSCSVMAACQAGADNTRQNQMLVYNELKKGTAPAAIKTRKGAAQRK